mgnify:CR=1 FL=1|jgi:diazepam-binding inhibitor (GABA receptor modulator, acyl-CoA-binding protein)
MSNSENFTLATQVVMKLSQTPSNQEKLVLYKFFKQATVGDVNTSRPGMLDFAGKAKWDAWESVKGTTKVDAETKYIILVNELIKNYGLNQ